MTKTKSTYLALLAVLLSPMTANAVPIQLDFTAYDLTGPIPTISGSIVYDAANIGATIDSLLSIDLTIDGFVYSLANISYLSPFDGDIDIIFGALSETGIVPGTDDFWLRWNRNTSEFFDFTYAYAAGSDEIYSTGEGVVTRSLVAVPEPGTLALLGLGLIGMAARRQKTV